MQKTTSATTICTASHGQPSCQVIRLSGTSSSASHAIRQLSSGYRAAIGSGATTATATSTAMAWSPQR